jgi:hypothetical protein
LSIKQPLAHPASYSCISIDSSVLQLPRAVEANAFNPTPKGLRRFVLLSYFECKSKIYDIRQQRFT